MSGKSPNLTVENLAASERQDHVPELKRHSIRDPWAHSPDQKRHSVRDAWAPHTTNPSIRRMSKMEPRQSVQYRRMSQVSRSSVTGSSLGGKHLGLDLYPMKLQPTYKLEPDKEERFKPERVHYMIQDVLEDCLDGENYQATQCRNIIQMMTDLIKGRVKDMGFSPRYKYIVTVNLAEDCNQALHLVSRCLWNERMDNMAEASYHNIQAKPPLYCHAAVYACYFD